MAKKVKQTAYQAAAAEFNDVMGMDPEIDVTLSDDELKPILVKAIGMIDPEDEFTEETQEVIDELKPKKGKKPVKEEAPAAPAKKGKKAPEPDPEDEEEEEEEDSDDDDEEEDDEPAPAKKPAKKEAAAPAKKEAKKEAAVPAKKAEKVETEEKSKKKGFPKTEGKSRIVCICDAVKALPAKGMDIKKLAEASNALYVKEGGAGKDNVKQSLHTFKVLMPVFIEFGIIKVSGETILPVK